MNRLNTFARRLLITYVVLVVAAAGLVVGAWKYQHLRLLSVQTDSMTPTFKHGDAILVGPPRSTSLKVGQIVSYHSPADPGVLVSHRIISIDRTTHLITTKGDNARRPDVSFSPSLVSGRVRASLPYAGYAIDSLHTLPGLALCLYLPALAVITNEVRTLARHYGRGYYRLPNFR